MIRVPRGGLFPLVALAAGAFLLMAPFVAVWAVRWAVALARFVLGA